MDEKSFRNFMIACTLIQYPRPYGNLWNLLEAIEEFLGSIDDYTTEEMMEIWNELLDNLVLARNELVEQGHPYNAFIGVLETLFDIYQLRQQLVEANADLAGELMSAPFMASVNVQLVRALVELGKLYNQAYVDTEPVELAFEMKQTGQV